MPVPVAMEMQQPSASRLVLLLLDAAMAALDGAMEAIRQEDPDRQEDCVGLASEIIGQLYLALDTEEGGPVAESIARIYTFILRRLPQVRHRGDLVTAREVIDVLAPLRDAWRAVNDNCAPMGFRLVDPGAAAATRPV